MTANRINFFLKVAHFSLWLMDRNCQLMMKKLRRGGKKVSYLIKVSQTVMFQVEVSNDCEIIFSFFFFFLCDAYGTQNSSKWLHNIGSWLCKIQTYFFCNRSRSLSWDHNRLSLKLFTLVTNWRRSVHFQNPFSILFFNLTQINLMHAFFQLHLKWKSPNFRHSFYCVINRE